MKPKSWIHENSISSTKVHLDLDEVDEKYVPWLTNRYFSNFVDTVLHANEVNMHSDLPHQLQYDYLFGSIRKGKRFYKKGKGYDSTDDEVEEVAKRYGYSRRKAIEAHRILKLTPEHLRDVMGEPF